MNSTFESVSKILDEAQIAKAMTPAMKMARRKMLPSVQRATPALRQKITALNPAFRFSQKGTVSRGEISKAIPGYKFGTKGQIE